MQYSFVRGDMREGMHSMSQVPEVLERTFYSSYTMVETGMEDKSAHLHGVSKTNHPPGQRASQFARLAGSSLSSTMMPKSLNMIYFLVECVAIKSSAPQEDPPAGWDTGPSHSSPLRERKAPCSSCTPTGSGHTRVKSMATQLQAKFEESTPTPALTSAPGLKRQVHLTWITVETTSQILCLGFLVLHTHQ